MKRAILRTLFALVTLTALTWTADYMLWRIGFPRNRPPFGTVRVQPYLAVPRKDGRTEFMLEDPADVQCSTSLFPHGGASPCWYLRRHAKQRVNL